MSNLNIKIIIDSQSLQYLIARNLKQFLYN